MTEKSDKSQDATRPGKSGSFVTYATVPDSAIRASSSDHGQSTSQSPSVRPSEQTNLENVKELGSRGSNGEPVGVSSPSSNIKRRFHSMSDLNQKMGANGLPLSNSLGNILSLAIVVNDKFMVSQAL